MAKERKPLECDERQDPVERTVRTCTPEEFVDWLIESHDMPESARQTVTLNLREQFKMHNLWGRLHRSPLALLVADLLRLKRATPEMYERPIAKA